MSTASAAAGDERMQVCPTCIQWLCMCMCCVCAVHVIQWSCMASSATQEHSCAALLLTRLAPTLSSSAYAHTGPGQQSPTHSDCVWRLWTAAAQQVVAHCNSVTHCNSQEQGWARASPVHQSAPEPDLQNWCVGAQPQCRTHWSSRKRPRAPVVSLSTTTSRTSHGSRPVWPISSCGQQ